MSPASAASAWRSSPTRCACTATSPAPWRLPKRSGKPFRKKESRLPPPKLFTPIQLGGVTLPNRIVVSPMCQYSADDGCMNDWHFIHLGHLAYSGAGLLMVEATHVTREGRITHGCTGLYNDHNEAAMARVIESCRRLRNAPMGIQIGHAGRKGSSQVPWEGREALTAAQSPWQTVAPAVREAWPKERALGARISANDWAEGGLGPDDAVSYARELKRLGFDYVCVSSAALVPHARVKVAPGYQVPYAAHVKKSVSINVRAVGMIADPEQAEEIIASGKADMVAMARAFLDNPRWVWHAAERFGVKLDYPPPYARSHPELWPGAKLARPRETA